MTERQLVRDFVKQLKGLEGIYTYKLGDTFGDHKKPFDLIVVYKSHFFAIEFKKQGETLKPHQEEHLQKVQNAGGYSFVAEFIPSDKHERNVRFYDFDSDQKLKFNAMRFIDLIWEKGRYQKISTLFHDLYILAF